MKRGAPQRGLQAALLLLLACAALLYSLPLYSFQAVVYTKKSANTFPGDEKYLAVREEVDAAAAEYRAGGFQVEILEDQTLRTNSKGVTSSLMTFTISETLGRSLWTFLGSGLPAGYVLWALSLCLLLSVLCGLAAAQKGDGSPKELSGGGRLLRSAGCCLALIALLLVPVFVMLNTYSFSRRLYLYGNGLLTQGKEGFYASLDRFLFQGKGGGALDSVLKGLSFRCSGLIWLLLPCAFLSLAVNLWFRFGTVKAPLLRMLLYLFIGGVCLVTLYPYYVMLITAFRSNAETTDMYFLHLLPTRWIFQNLVDIVHRGVPRYLLNSLLIAGGATGIAMLCGVPAAYALARLRFRGKSFFLGFVIMSQMFSPVVLLIGIAQLMSTLHLNDSIVGLMLIDAAFNQAFAIWLLRGTFISISPEMEQAALIDGCSTRQSLTRVLLPMAAPGIVTALIFVFINAWNEYTISTVLISTSSNRPITVGITQFSSFNMIEWQYLFAASLLATIPVVILFMFIEKYLVSGLTSGGVKG